MRAQYLFSFLAVAATAALFWHPKPPPPVMTTRDQNGLEVRITKHEGPHRFEDLPVPSLENPDETAFEVPRSYVRSRLCAGDDVMLASVQGRLLLTPGEGHAFGELGDCAHDAPFCPRAASALDANDAGLSIDELEFFAGSLADCDPERFAALRTDLRLPLAVRVHAWSLLADAGLWSPELDAVVDEQLATRDDPKRELPSWQLAIAVLGVREESPRLLDASRRLMDRYPMFQRIFRRSPVLAVRKAACEKSGCDAGVGEPVDAGVDREELAACALQRDKGRDCLERLAMLDWPMAHLVAQRVEGDDTLAAALREFETHQAFVDFARSVSVAPRADGGLMPWELLGTPDRKTVAQLFTANGLGADELASRWAAQAPELKGAFFWESGEGETVRLSGGLGDDLFSVLVRRQNESLDARAVLALLDVMVTERGASKRFFLIDSGWSSMVRYADPAQISALIARGLVKLEDPDKARHEED